MKKCVILFLTKFVLQSIFVVQTDIVKIYLLGEKTLTLYLDAFLILSLVLGHSLKPFALVVRQGNQNLEPEIVETTLVGSRFLDIRRRNDFVPGRFWKKRLEMRLVIVVSAKNDSI